jgi:hypothetical protein
VAVSGKLYAETMAFACSGYEASVGRICTSAVDAAASSTAKSYLSAWSASAHDGERKRRNERHGDIECAPERSTPSVW